MLGGDPGDSPWQVGSGGFVHMLPMRLPLSISGGAQVSAASPWGGPIVTGVLGTTMETDESVAIVAYEWPVPVATGQQPRTRDAEQRQVGRFITDHLMCRGAPPFHVLQTRERPDFAVRTASGDEGVDVTALTDSKRREALALLRELRERILLRPRDEFTQLTVSSVYLWFTDADAPAARPFRRHDFPATEALVDALARYTPDREAMHTPGSGLPPDAPSLDSRSTAQGATFYAIPMTGGVPSTDFFARTGFELGLAYTTHHTSDDVWAEVQRLVDKHDYPGVDRLIITAAAPDAAGNLHAGESLLAQLLVMTPRDLSPTPKHVASVYLHEWTTGTAYRLWPEFVHIFGPTHAGQSIPYLLPHVAEPNDRADP